VRDQERKGAHIDSPFGVTTTFIIRGCLTAIDAIKDPLDRVMCRAVSRRVERQLRHLRCAQHQQQVANVIAFGPSADELSFAVEGCCQPLIHAASAALVGASFFWVTAARRPS